MKAGSAVLTQVQNQMTMFGLPVPLLMMAVIAGALAMVLMVIIEVFILMIPFGVIGMAGAWLFFVRKVKSNLHYDREIMLPAKFWRSRKHQRLLTAGVKK